ncbi:MAG: CAP domain-containing protein [Verrucomicrobiales bacterium]|jgi:uncharacterized protein YkwD|nr:CAP domain-containing protein [Verrucomicrobiales bacterium]
MNRLFRGLLAFLLLASATYAADDAFFEKTLEQINLQRAKANLQPVSLDEKLTRIAGEWAVKNAQADNMMHRKNLNSFMGDFNYSYINENLFYAKSSTGSRPTPEQVVTAWMNSTGHRRNMLKDRIDRIGLGIAQARDGGYYVVFNGADSHPPKQDETPANDQIQSSDGVKFNGIPLR